MASRWTRKAGWVAASVVLCGSAWAQEAVKAGGANAGIVAIYDAARMHDPTLASAEAAYQAAIEVVPQAKAALGPNVSAAVSGADVHSTQQGGPTEHGSSTSETLTATQPLFHRASWLTLDQAKAKLPGLEATLRAARQDLILRVAQTYFNVLQAREALDQTLQQRQMLLTSDQEAIRAYEIGTGTIIDQANARSQLDVNKATEVQVRAALAMALRTLALLTGAPAPDLAPLTLARLMDRVEGDENAWAAKAVAQGLPVLQAQATLTASRLGVDAAKAAGYPTLDLTAALDNTRLAQRNLIYNNLTAGRSAYVGLQLNIPIWDSGARASQVRQASALAVQADQDMAVARQQAEVSARQAWIGLEAGTAQIAAYGQAVQSSQIAVDAAQKGFGVGSRTMVDVLAAQGQLFSTRIQLSQSRYATALSLLQLKASAGELTETDLQGLTP